METIQTILEDQSATISLTFDNSIKYDRLATTRMGNNRAESVAANSTVSSLKTSMLHQAIDPTLTQEENAM